MKLEASLKGEEIGYNDDDLDMDYYDRVTRLTKLLVPTYNPIYNLYF